MTTIKTQRPSFINYLKEVPRRLQENIHFYQFKKHFKPEKIGDGHPVVVIPGFMASGRSTKPLRKFINQIGFTAYDWGLGRNLGNLKNLDVLGETIDKLAEKHQTKVTLIGWSLGGIFARHLSHEKPEKIRQLITMGSPFAGLTNPNNAAWLYDFIHPNAPLSSIPKEWIENLPNPVSVPSTAIFSKKDGIVPWAACREIVEGEFSENIEVSGSHIGLGVNPDIYKIIFEKLPMMKDDWKKYSTE